MAAAAQVRPPLHRRSFVSPALERHLAELVHNRTWCGVFITPLLSSV
jgi:hypothetical protein